MKSIGCFKYIVLSLIFAVFAFAALPAGVYAAGEGLSVSGGTKGKDYTYEDGVLTILKNGEYTISMASGTTNDRIAFSRDDKLTKVTLNLKSLNIETDECVMSLDDTEEGVTPAALDLTLNVDGTNKLKSLKKDMYKADNKVTLTISGSGTLEAGAPASDQDGFVLAGGSNLKMNGGILKITADRFGIYADEKSTASQISFSGGETEITAGTNALNLKNATKKDAVFDSGYTHKNYDGATAASRTAVSDADLTDSQGSSDNYVLITPAYKVTCNKNGGEYPSGSSNPTSYSKYDSFTLKNPGRTNYTFLGWTGTGYSSPTKTVTVSKGSTGDRSYVAQWQETTVTIQYAAGTGGKVSRSSETVKRVTGSAQGSKATASSGYKFKNWTNQNGAVVSTSATFVPPKSGNVNVAAAYTARFEKTKAVITFNPNGGKLSGSTAVQKKSYAYGQIITMPRPTRTGYTFRYWKGSMYRVGTKYTVKGNHTFTAVWRKRSSYSSSSRTSSSSRIGTNSRKTSSSSSSSKSTSARSSAKTGDVRSAGRTAAWIVMFAMAGVIIGVIALRRREDRA